MPTLRYFYSISFVLLVLAAVFLVIYSRDYVENSIIKTTAADNNHSIASTFANTLWQKHRVLLGNLPCDKGKCPDVTELKRDFLEFASDMSLLKVELYNSDGSNLLYSDKNSKDSVLTLFSEAKKGKEVSDLVLEYEVGGDNYNVVRTFFPIQNGSTPLILEVVYNISGFWANPDLLQVIVISGIVLVLAIVFGTMYFTTLKTEKLIAKQYDANLKLITAKASAEQENLEKSQFLANVSHELRTPLNAIIGFSEIIKDEVMGPLNNQQYKDYVTDIHLSGVHLLSLINDILDYSKAGAGKLEIALAEADVTKIMHNSIRLIKPRADDAQVMVVSDIPKDHYILVTDGKRLKQIILNLLSNAVKFTPDGGTVTLSANHDLEDSTFIVKVADTGVGIAEKDIQKVMATFGQVENQLSRRYEGTGLGLPLCNRLVDLMGGSMKIDSKEGEGTTVTVILPYVAAEDDNNEES